MAYLIRSKGRTVLLRDGTKQEDPIYEVGPRDFVLFQSLPAGTGAHGDGDVEVKEVTSAEGHEPAKPYVKPAPKPLSPKHKPQAERLEQAVKGRGGRASMAGRASSGKKAGGDQPL